MFSGGKWNTWFTVFLIQLFPCQGPKCQSKAQTYVRGMWNPTAQASWSLTFIFKTISTSPQVIATLPHHLPSHHTVTWTLLTFIRFLFRSHVKPSCNFILWPYFSQKVFLSSTTLSIKLWQSRHQVWEIWKTLVTDFRLLILYRFIPWLFSRSCWLKESCRICFFFHAAGFCYSGGKGKS